MLTFAVLAAVSLNITAQSTPPSSSNGATLPHPTLLNEFRHIGGSGNNLNNPNFDVPPGTPEVAIAPLNFAPGGGDGLVSGPNPRVISNVIAGGTGANGQTGDTADPIASAWLYVFGQFVDHDLDLESTPPTTAPINIVIPANDPVFTPGTIIPMTRDARDPTTNTITNTVAGYLDLSQLYGSTTDVARSLRNHDGTLVTSADGQALPVVDGVFVTGDPRVMENPELTAVTTLFMREHNFWVGQLSAQNPDWTGHQLYNMARAITTAEYQNIIYSEYLPLLVGQVLGPYKGYDSGVNAQVTQEFSTAAFRLGHSEVSDTQEGLDSRGNVVFTESLAQAFFNTPAEDESNGMDPLLRGISADFSQATDVYTVSALRNLLFAGLVGGEVDQIDLIAIDIQRERDVGLGTLNQTRTALGFNPYRSFAQITSDPVLQANLQLVYGDVNNLDLFIGGLAEDHASGALVGPTFQAIIAEQFAVLRAGDRFFWQNQAFDPDTAQAISQTTLADIIKRNTGITVLQDHVFLAPAPAVHTHVSQTRNVDNHGRRGVPFIIH
jgi:peroxidase